MDIKSRLPGAPATAKTEELPLWASLHPRKHTAEDVERLLSALRALPLESRLEPLRALALDGREDRHEVARASLALARLSFDENRHFTNEPACNWLWRSAHCGSVTGALMLACELVGRANMLERTSGPRDATAKRRVAAMRTLACDWLPSVWLMDPELDSLPATIARELRQPSLHAGPTRVVIERWAFERGSTEMEVFRTLAQDVPLVGGDRNPSSIIEQLHREFPWMTSAIDRVADDLALCSLAAQPWIRIRPLLLVGPPGSGKSRFARRLAELIGTGYRLIGAGGRTDDRDLAGTAHGWSNHEPSSVLRLMAACGAANPLIIVDEIDKAGGSDRNGDIRRVLLGMLEPETAKRWFDECLQAHCDLSAVSWILTANTLDTISRPLRSRVAITRVDLPGPDAIAGILDGMRADIAAELGLDSRILPEIDIAARRALAEAFGSGRSLRVVKSALVRALAAGARMTGRLS